MTMFNTGIFLKGDNSKRESIHHFIFWQIWY